MDDTQRETPVSTPQAAVSSPGQGTVAEPPPSRGQEPLGGPGEYVKKNIFSIVAALPIGLLAVGAFTINIALSKYGILDFPLLNSRTVYVGFMASFILGAFIILWFTYVSLRGAKGEMLILLLNLLWKPLMLSSVVWQYLLAKPDTKWQLGRFTISSSQLVSIALMMVIAFVFLFVNGREYILNGAKKDKLGRLALRTGVVFSLIGAVPTVALIVLLDDFRNVFLTLMYISGALFVPAATLWALRNDRSRGIKVQPSSLYSKDRKLTRMDYVYSAFWIVVVAMVSITLYSRNIYPNMPTTLGGGQYGYNEVTLVDGSTTKGVIIHTSSDFLYIVTSDDKLHQIAQSQISEYAKN